MYAYLIYLAVYTMFGLFIEILYTGISNVTDGEISGRDKYLEGKTYLWMIPIYGILLTGLFHPLYQLLAGLDIIYRFIIWAILITSFEALTGWAYDKWLGFCPWDYSRSKWKVFERGYTKWYLLPLWGLAGLVIEHVTRLLIYLNPYINAYFS